MEAIIAELLSRPPSGTLRLGDRTLAYSEVGAAGGRPVFYFTGGDSSRLEGLWLDEAARGLGIRLITPDRPGFGDSDPLAERKLTDWPTDVVAIADQLGLERFGVLGLSGGGPHALVTAWAYPERVSALAVVGSAPPPRFEALARDVAFPFRLLSWLTRRAPWILKKLLNQQRELAESNPQKLLKQTIRGVGGADATYLEGEGGPLYVAMKRLGYQAGVAGSVQEHLLYRGDWGFELSEIRVPTTLYIGDEDVMASRAANAAIADTIPGAELVVLPGVGHLSLIPSRGKTLLEGLLNP